MTNLITKSKIKIGNKQKRMKKHMLNNNNVKSIQVGNKIRKKCIRLLCWEVELVLILILICKFGKIIKKLRNVVVAIVKSVWKIFHIFCIWYPQIKVYPKFLLKVGQFGSMVLFIAYIDLQTGKFFHYHGKNIHKPRHIASLTKMLTAMIAIDFLKTNNYEPDKVLY